MPTANFQSRKHLLRWSLKATIKIVLFGSSSWLSLACNSPPLLNLVIVIEMRPPIQSNPGEISSNTFGPPSHQDLQINYFYSSGPHYGDHPPQLYYPIHPRTIGSRPKCPMTTLDFQFVAGLLPAQRQQQVSQIKRRFGTGHSNFGGDRGEMVYRDK